MEGIYYDPKPFLLYVMYVYHCKLVLYQPTRATNLHIQGSIVSEYSRASNNDVPICILFIYSTYSFIEGSLLGGVVD